MAFESPDLDTFKHHLETIIDAINKHKAESHAAIKIQSLLNMTAYVLATRFIEGSVKHIVYNCCVMRKDNQVALNELESELKRFNNPEFSNIVTLFETRLNFKIIQGMGTHYVQRDVTLLNQIVNNRHKNVHASYDSTEWYNQNKKDIADFMQEYPSLIKIVEFLDHIAYNSTTSSFEIVV
jgi:hypothetical protein